MQRPQMVGVLPFAAFLPRSSGGGAGCAFERLLQRPSQAIVCWSLQNMLTDDDMADLMAPLQPGVKCAIVAGAFWHIRKPSALPILDAERQSCGISIES